ncbi:hypothetical protein PG993_005827 [Apiospora rasikravindrae]|uniref:BZIP domain-containing protein n=1 Tax=Apiospora rasikravindrae TaxID=990691 RepID=A0ABR1T9W9_9PEZI
MPREASNSRDSPRKGGHKKSKKSKKSPGVTERLAANEPSNGMVDAAAVQRQREAAARDAIEEVPADREANRQSQQQARQRQREYVAGLEKKVAEHERRGVQATIEVQQAARAVAATNQKLLALLRIHGVHDAEIDAFLGEPAPEKKEAAPVDSHGLVEPAARRHTSLRSVDSSAAGMPTGQRPLPGTRPLPAPESKETPPASTPRVASQLPHETSGGGVSSRETGGCEQKGAVCSSSPRTTQPAAGASQELPGQETSCDTAAGIISELHGLDDLSKARTFLGCTTRGPCSVRNMRLFELMDRTE